MLLVGIGLSFHLWAILKGHVNFSSDEALAGLATQHALRGEWHTYAIGQRYFGNVWIPFVAPLFLLLGKGSILALRLPSFLMTVLFTVLFLCFVYRAWGRRVALLTAALMAVPGFYVLYFLFVGPFNYWAPLLMLCILLIAFPDAHRTELSRLRSVLLGGLVGFGLWVTPRFGLDAVMFAVVLLLASQEWSVLYTRIAQIFGERRVEFLAARIVVVTILFSAAVRHVIFESTAKEVAYTKWFLSFCALVMLVALFWSSHRKNRLSICALYLFAGFAVGNVPQWVPWVFFGTFPFSSVRFHDPSLSTLKPLFDLILPLFWGAEHPVSLWVEAGYPWGKICMLSAVSVIAMFGIVTFFYRERSTICTLLTGRPLPVKKIPTAFLFFLFVLPLLTLYYKGIIPRVGNFRFAVSAWPAFVVLLALSFEQLLQRWRSFGVFLVAFFIAYIGTSTVHIGNRIWRDSSSHFPPDAVYSLEKTLVTEDALGGYANYWIGYGLNFLLEEREVFSQLQGDRYPPYTARVSALKRFAVITFADRHAIPTASNDSADLIENLLQTNPVVLPAILKSIRSSVLQSRFTIGGIWDVWIFKRT